MKRIIFALIAAVMIEISFYSILSLNLFVPSWITHWTFKLLLFIFLVWFLGFLWNKMSKADDSIADRKITGESMKLDQDVRRAILDRSRLIGQDLAEAFGKLDSIGQSEIAEEARKARSMIETFARTFSSQPSGPGPMSAGLNFGEKDASRLVIHDKKILAIIETVADSAYELASNAGRDITIDKGIINEVADAARTLTNLIATRDEIFKGIK